MYLSTPVNRRPVAREPSHLSVNNDAVSRQTRARDRERAPRRPIDARAKNPSHETNASRARAPRRAVVVVVASRRVTLRIPQSRACSRLHASRQLARDQTVVRGRGYELVDAPEGAREQVERDRTGDGDEDGAAVRAALAAQGQPEHSTRAMDGAGGREGARIDGEGRRYLNAGSRDRHFESS